MVSIIVHPLSSDQILQLALPRHDPIDRKYFSIVVKYLDTAPPLTVGNLVGLISTLKSFNDYYLFPTLTAEESGTPFLKIDNYLIGDFPTRRINRTNQEDFFVGSQKAEEIIAKYLTDAKVDKFEACHILDGFISRLSKLYYCMYTKEKQPEF